jgi:hypothetical protein
VHVANVGKAEKTAFVNCNLPAWLRNEEMLDRRFSQRLTSGKKTIVGFVRLRGKPR